MSKINDAISIIKALGFPKAQQNERSALCLLGLLDMKPNRAWSEAKNPLIGITPLIDFARNIYGKDYAPNTRETFRRQTMHQFVDGGLARYNPDQPNRPVNSPKAVYQIAPEALELIKHYGTNQWDELLEQYLKKQPALAERYAKRRDLAKIPLQTPQGEIKLSPGTHSQLIKDIVDEFGPRFAPGAELIYVGDTGDKVGYFDEKKLKELGVSVDKHGKMPDVVLYYPEKDWLLLIESVTSHGPVDPKRHEELATLFKDAKPGIVYVTAFPDRSTMAKYAPEISWETEVWTADSPTHLVHFDGKRFLGPYGKGG